MIHLSCSNWTLSLTWEKACIRSFPVTWNAFFDCAGVATLVADSAELLRFRLVVFTVTVWGVTSITESGRYIKRCSMTSAAQMVPCRTPRLDIEGDTIFPAMPTSWCFASFPHDYREVVSCKSTGAQIILLWFKRRGIFFEFHFWAEDWCRLAFYTRAT